MTRRVALLTVLAAAAGPIRAAARTPAGQGVSVVTAPDGQVRLVVALGDQPYALGGLEVRHGGKALSWSSDELWAALGGTL
jgi:hypothetical protein